MSVFEVKNRTPMVVDLQVLCVLYENILCTLYRCLLMDICVQEITISFEIIKMYINLKYCFFGQYDA